ncbi:gluconate 2-dehydrogenase subunit 3 family protein [Fulvivirgaceae bacterium BMA10]|uniref:Gluconate 2-dehydrogenase subunit 3 family protein n=1 Tax=Splendidivirga corallicola TaxID=3051826 RepID=A0ABT8KPS0_9BACT|nr:gluconate 2-dehydrogenase subunit 3 family protein [Fulvivirgaceae bacterium BMA10]
MNKKIMDNKKYKISRRDSLRYITLASMSTGMFLSCNPEEKQTEVEEHGHEHPETAEGFANLSEEDLQLLNEKFFTDHELETVRVLGNIVIPADDRSGNAEDAGVPMFIEFMMLDQPMLQIPMRGGLKWLDLQALNRFDAEFINCTPEQQIEIVEDIAYPEVAKPEMSQGVAFFNRFRDFVATGFWTSQMGIEDIQYLGNKPTIWEGPPKEWLDKLGVSDIT